MARLRKSVFAFMAISSATFFLLYSLGLFEFSPVTGMMTGYDNPFLFDVKDAKWNIDVEKIPKEVPEEIQEVPEESLENNREDPFTTFKTFSTSIFTTPVTTSTPQSKTATARVTTTRQTTTTNIPLTTLPPGANPDFKFKHNVNVLRKKFGSERSEFQEKCKKLNISTELSEDKIDRIILSGPKMVMICDTPKVASTSFRRAFADSHPSKTGKWKYFYNSQDMQWAKHLDYHWFVESALPSYFKFLATRNPYSRLLSAYRDKIAPSNEVLRKDVNGPGADGNARGPALYASKHDAHFKERGTTFEMFLRYVHETYHKNTANLHWRAVSDVCFPCAMHFDYVGQLEDERTKSLLMGFLYRNETMADDLNFPTYHQSHKNSTSILIREYSKVDKSVIQAIQKVYMNDFLLFDYNLEPF